MKALYYRGSEGGLEWRDDPEPQLQAATDALVRPVAVSTCDLDQAVLAGGVPGSEQPFALGHEGVGEVVETGDAVVSLTPGDLVAIPYHIACGHCDRCADELPLYCRTSAADGLAVFGVPVGDDYGGLFSDLVRVPFADYGLVPLPPNVSPASAVSVGDNLTDAWRAVVPHLRRRPGSDVLIMGGGSVGLFAADIARACGARLVRYVDPSSVRQDIARELGAEASSPEEFDPGAHEYEISFVNPSSVKALHSALYATAPGGHCENAGFHFEPTSMPLFAMHTKGLHFRTALANVRPHMPSVLELLASGRISPELVATEVLPFDTAAEAMSEAGFKPVFVREPIIR